MTSTGYVFFPGWDWFLSKKNGLKNLQGVDLCWALWLHPPVTWLQWFRSFRLSPQHQTSTLFSVYLGVSTFSPCFFTMEVLGSRYGRHDLASIFACLQILASLRQLGPTCGTAGTSTEPTGAATVRGRKAPCCLEDCRSWWRFALVQSGHLRSDSTKFENSNIWHLVICVGSPDLESDIHKRWSFTLVFGSCI